MARSKTASVIDTIESLAILGAVAYGAYYIMRYMQASNAQNSSGSATDTLWNAITGTPTGAQIEAPPVYTGANAPEGNQSMLNFLNSGGDVNSVIPGTGQTAGQMISGGASWDDVNSAWQSATNPQLTSPISSAASRLFIGGVPGGLLGWSQPPNAYSLWYAERTGQA